MHEVVAQWDPSQATTEYDRYNHTISYQPVICKSKLDCPIHFDTIMEFEEPVILIPGLSVNDPEVIEANKKYAEQHRKRKELQFLIAAMEVSEISLHLLTSPVFDGEFDDEEEEGLSSSSLSAAQRIERLKERNEELDAESSIIKDFSNSLDSVNSTKIKKKRRIERIFHFES